MQRQIEEYGVVLPWTVFRLMTFGNIASFLIALQPHYRDKVATHINEPLSDDIKIPTKVLLSWCNALRYLRNICSHNARRYGRFHNTLPKIHHADRPLLALNLKGVEKMLFLYFVTIRHLLLSMSEEAQLFWNQKLQELLVMSECNNVELVKYGFPEKWMQLLTI